MEDEAVEFKPQGDTLTSASSYPQTALPSSPPTFPPHILNHQIWRHHLRAPAAARAHHPANQNRRADSAGKTKAPAQTTPSPATSTTETEIAIAHHHAVTSATETVFAIAVPDATRTIGIGRGRRGGMSGIEIVTRLIARDVVHQDVRGMGLGMRGGIERGRIDRKARRIRRRRRRNLLRPNLRSP